MKEQPEGSKRSGVLQGALAVIAVAVICLSPLALSSAMNVPAFSISATVLAMSIGLAQWLALAPLIVRAHKRRHKRTIQGLLLLGGTAFLLNATCWATIAFSTWARRS